MAIEFEQNVEWLNDVSHEEMRRIVDALYRVHRLNAMITDMDTVLEGIMEESKELAGAEACSLLLYDEEKNDLYFHVAMGESGDQQALKHTVRLKLTDGIAGAAATTQESVNVQDVYTDTRFFDVADTVSKFETKSLLAVPMIRKGDLVGVLEVLNKSGGGAFTEVDRRTMEVFSSLAAGVILNARLIEANLKTERLVAVGQAVAGLSHYTKNILGGLHGSIDLIDEGLESNNSTLLEKGWRVLKRSAERLSNIVEDMLAYSKVRQPLRSETDLRLLIEEVGESFLLLMSRKEVELVLELDELPKNFSLDPNGLHRCMLNLLINAGDAVPAEGGKVRVCGGTTESGALEIEIHDNGSGVSDDVKEAIFDPFFSTKGSGGTGLGLAVTIKIISEHGGTIAVEDSPEGGALFRLILPKI